MARQYEGHTLNDAGYAHDKGHKRTSGKKSRSKKKQKVISAGFLSTTLLLGIVFFAVCFVIGMVMGPSLPI